MRKGKVQKEVVTADEARKLAIEAGSDPLPTLVAKGVFEDIREAALDGNYCTHVSYLQLGEARYLSSIGFDVRLDLTGKMLVSWWNKKNPNQV